jgi:acyl-CoA hydrolase
MKTGDALQNIFMIFVRLHKLTISRHVHPAPASVVPGRSSLSIMTRIKKTPADSALSMTELVLPNDTNTMNNLMGGRLMHWMDVVSAIVAQRHANRLVVTASVDNISFRHPIALGNVVTLRARVTRAFRTSMEVRIDVEAEDAPSGKKFESNSAFFTFVAMDENGKPAEEKELYDGALRRRQLRLVLAGKMKPGDASELKSIFKLPDA